MSAVPRAITGGSVSLMMAAYSYISDISTHETRTKRIALVDLMFIISSPIGLYLSDVLFKSVGYSGVYGISSLMLFSCIVYAITFIKETKGPLAFQDIKFEEGPSEMDHCKSLFDVRHVKETMQACLKKRSNGNSIMLLMINICLLNFIYGEF